MSSEELLAKVTNLLTKQHKVLYYGPMSENEVRNLLAEHHDVAGELEPLERKYPQKVLTPEASVFIAPYDARQSITYSTPTAVRSSPSRTPPPSKCSTSTSAVA